MPAQANHVNMTPDGSVIVHVAKRRPERGDDGLEQRMGDLGHPEQVMALLNALRNKEWITDDDMPYTLEAVSPS